MRLDDGSVFQFDPKIICLLSLGTLTKSNVIFRLAIIRRNMPIEQHRRTDIFGAKSTGIMSYEVGGVDSGSSWPFGQVTMH